MFEYRTHNEFASHGWLKHSLPWLAVFAFVLDLMQDRDFGSPPEENDIYFG